MHIAERSRGLKYRVKVFTGGMAHGGRHHQKWEATNPSHFDGLVNSNIDEASYKKRLKYLTVVINRNTASLVWCRKEYGKEALSLLFELLIRGSEDLYSSYLSRWSLMDCLLRGQILPQCPTGLICLKENPRLTLKAGSDKISNTLTKWMGIGAAHSHALLLRPSPYAPGQIIYPFILPMHLSLAMSIIQTVLRLK